MAWKVEGVNSQPEAEASRRKQKPEGTKRVVEVMKRDQEEDIGKKLAEAKKREDQRARQQAEVRREVEKTKRLAEERKGEQKHGSSSGQWRRQE